MKIHKTDDPERITSSRLDRVSNRFTHRLCDCWMCRAIDNAEAIYKATRWPKKGK